MCRGHLNKLPHNKKRENNKLFCTAYLEEIIYNFFYIANECISSAMVSVTELHCGYPQARFRFLLWFISVTICS